MDNGTVLIVLLIIVGVIVIVFLLRDRITKLGARASLDKREGEFNIEAADPKQSPKEMPADKHSVNISGNRQLGKSNVIEVERSDVNVQNNLQLGKAQQITTKSEQGRNKK